MRRKILPWVSPGLLLMLFSAAFAGAPPLDQGKSTADDALDALQASGKDVRSFTADVRMEEADLVMDTAYTLIGKVWFNTNPSGDAVVRVSFDQKQLHNKVVPHKLDYLLDNGWVTERDYAAKHETRIQLTPPGQKTDLFQLGKGPFPLPVGQDKKQVLAQFDVTKVPPTAGDPPNSIHLQLVPKPGTQLAKSFSRIDVWVDCSTRMPSRIQTRDKNLTKQRTTDLSNLKVNAPIDPQDVKLPPLNVGDWTVDVKPLTQQQ